MNTFPKFTTIGGGCFSYKRLEKEGYLGQVTCFVDETKVDCDTWEEPEFTPENDPYGGH